MLNLSPVPVSLRQICNGGRLLFIIAFVVSLIGCASLPDLSGYTAATDQLRQSVKSAGDSVITEIDLLSIAFKESGGSSATESTLENTKSDLQKHWEYRNSAMTALVGYASSLEAIASAGKEGKESAKALGSSVEELLGSLGIVPGAQLVGVAKETIEIIYAEVAKVRAQDSLDKSLSKTGSIMENIVEILENDTNKIKTSFELAIDGQLLQLQSNNEPVLGMERDDLITLRTYRNKALVTELTHPDRNQHSKKIKELTEDVSIIDTQLSILNTEWNSYSKELQELKKRKRLGLGLIQASSKALTVWKNTHIKLSEAVKKKSSPSIHEMIAVANDIQALIEKWSEL